MKRIAKNGICILRAFFAESLEILTRVIGAGMMPPRKKTTSKTL
jgi:hypothetical protein